MAPCNDVSFDHLVRALQQDGRNGELECLSRPGIDDQLYFCDLLHGQIGRFLALENTAGVDPHEPPSVRNTGSIAYQATRYSELANRVDSGQPVAEHQCGE